MNHRLIPLRLLSFVLVLFAIAHFPSIATAADEETAAPEVTIADSVVKVFTTARYPDPYRPWTKQAARESTGSGVIIEGNRILTNAHVVLYASQVQVQASQSAAKVSAEVEAIAPDIDLAILKVEDESFFQNRPVITRATTIPNVKEPVTVYGYPTGGMALSLTNGIVSRIEFSMHRNQAPKLRIQIDAAINPGNSGGPAVVDDQMIGLAYSRLDGADNIGYIIPCEEIDLFLADVASDGRYDGKPMLHDELQTLENPALRAMLRLPNEIQGIVVREPFRQDEDYPLRKWDVLTAIGDYPIDNEGMVRITDQLRLPFQYLIQRLAQDGHVPLSVMRDAVSLQVSQPVNEENERLIPALRGAYPSYFVYGPLAFSAASADLVGSLGHQIDRAYYGLSSVSSPLVTRWNERVSKPGEQLVVVTMPLFPHRIGLGYSNPITKVVSKVNGKSIHNLLDLVRILRDCQDEYITIDFAESPFETFVFQRKEIEEVTEDILTDNGVRRQGSEDVMAVFESRES